MSKCKHEDCVIFEPEMEECDDCVNGRLIELVSEYASTCDGCAELTSHEEMTMDGQTQLGYCVECAAEMDLLITQPAS